MNGITCKHVMLLLFVYLYVFLSDWMLKHSVYWGMNSSLKTPVLHPSLLPSFLINLKTSNILKYVENLPSPSYLKIWKGGIHTV